MGAKPLSCWPLSDPLDQTQFASLRAGSRVLAIRFPYQSTLFIASQILSAGEGVGTDVDGDDDDDVGDDKGAVEGAAAGDAGKGEDDILDIAGMAGTNIGSGTNGNCSGNSGSFSLLQLASAIP
jgi:hypothetical protein